jgi:hypothetical protein
MFGAFNTFRFCWEGTCGYADVVGLYSEWLAAIFWFNIHLMIVDEGSSAVVQVDSFVCPIALVDPIELLDFGSSFFDESAIIEGDFGEVVAVVFAFMDNLVDRCEVPTSGQFPTQVYGFE